MSNSENPKKGADFQRQVQEYFNKRYGLGFELEKKIPIGEPPKDHKFDIVNLSKGVAIECKRYTWTETGNVPSAKMGFVNEAVFYLSFLPDSYKKYIVMLYSYHQKRHETLAEYYHRTYQHLLGDVIVAEYNPDNQQMRVIGKSEQDNVIDGLLAEDSRNSIYDENQFFAMPDNCYTRPAQIPIRKERLYYLEHTYSPQANDKWVMFDARYDCYRSNTDWDKEEDPIVAVLYEMTINLDTTPYNEIYPKRGDFGVLADLILEDL